MSKKPVVYCFGDEREGEHVSLRGWVHRLRKHKGTVFLNLRDSSGIIQCVIPDDITPSLSVESSIEVEGRVVKDDRSPDGYEIHADKVNIVGLADDYPIRRDFSTEFLNDVRHLWNRSRKITNVMKVKSEVLRSAREWFDSQGWYETTPPIITKSACEGGATLFKVDYFDEQAYLSQSAQLYLEALIYSLESVWSLTPSFRAEKSKTPRHLAEYWHLEGEQAWATFDDILKVEEELLAYVCKTVAERRHKELELLGRNPADLQKVTVPFDRVPYADAIRFLRRRNRPIEYGNDFGTDDERLLTLESDKPIFIYGAPKSIKPFYTKVDPRDETMVLSADILAPKGYGEISSGGQREEDLDSIVRRLREEGFDPKDYSWYLDLRRYGSVPHSGFGLGIERLTRYICNLEHIRDTTPFPRTMKRCYP